MRRLAALAVPYRLWRSVPEESPSCLKRRMKSIPLVVPLRTIFATNTQLVISRALLRLSLDTAQSTWTHAPAAMAGFFFQAEDGIRDLIVTGVQTCALPI